jgi:ubiquinone/menaquinone biosynthesis C-methylase UbiE
MKLFSKPMAGAYRGWVDWANSETISGWAARLARASEPVSVDIAINGQQVATLRASLFRDDLRREGIGDGCNGFVFHPAEYLREGHNRVVISYAATRATLPNGEQVILHRPTAAGPAGRSEADLLAISQLRWKGDENDSWLTWGTRMTGDSFIDAVAKYHAFSAADRVLEIGPGSGRLLLTIQERQLPFATYLGLELSRARVEKLTKKFASPAIRFLTADVMADTFDLQSDVVLCSSTFEHLYPSIEAALHNLYRMSQAGAKLFIDFIWNEGDNGLSISQAYFEYTSAYIRMYSRAELEALFPAAGFRVLGIESIVLGHDRHGKDVRRALVVAERP